MEGIHLICEVCKEESLVAVPAHRTRYGLLDCPRCGCAYLLLLDPGPGADPRTTSALT